MIMEYVEFLEARFCDCGYQPAVRGVEEGFVRVDWVVSDFVGSCGYGVQVQVCRFCGECGVLWVPPPRLFRRDRWCCAFLFTYGCFRGVVVVNCGSPAGGREYCCLGHPRWVPGNFEWYGEDGGVFVV